MWWRHIKNKIYFLNKQLRRSVHHSIPSEKKMLAWLNFINYPKCIKTNWEKQRRKSLTMRWTCWNRYKTVCPKGFSAIILIKSIAPNKCASPVTIKEVIQKKASRCIHKSKPHYSKGLCKNCYLKNYYKKRIQKPERSDVMSSKASIRSIYEEWRHYQILIRIGRL